MENINEIFSYVVVCDIVNRSDDSKLRSLAECQNRHDWLKWKDVIQTELNSLDKCKVFDLFSSHLKLQNP